MLCGRAVCCTTLSWRVMGRKTVTVFREGQKPQVQQVGDEITLA